MIRIKFEVTFNEKKAKSFFSKKLSPVLVFSTIILSFALALGINLVFAWTEPGADPPGGNVAAPINVSSTAQTKAGTLTLGGGAIINQIGATWGGWYESIRLNQAAHSAITHPGGGLLFGLHGNRNFYWADTTNGWYAMTLSASGNLYTRGTLTIGSYGDIYSDAGWLRLNQNHTQNIYTPRIIRADGGFQVDGNTVIDANAGWHRTYGNTGWYNGTWGGGWYMIDATWVRSYANKSVYTAGSIRADTSLCIGTDCRSVWPSGGGGGDDDWDIYSDRVQATRGEARVGEIRAYIMKDWDNTNFYVDPNSTSRMVTADVNTVYTGIMYDRNDIGYYCNPSGTSKLINLTLTGDLIANSNSTGGCYWYGDDFGSNQTRRGSCNNGYFMAGVETRDNGKINLIKCCRL